MSELPDLVYELNYIVKIHNQIKALVTYALLQPFFTPTHFGSLIQSTSCEMLRVMCIAFFFF